MNRVEQPKPGQAEGFELAERDPGSTERGKFPNKVCIAGFHVVKYLINERVM